MPGKKPRATEFDKYFGDLLQKERKRRGFKSTTQFSEEIERLSGIKISHHTIDRIERGEQPAKVEQYALFRLALYGGIKDSFLERAAYPLEAMDKYRRFAQAAVKDADIEAALELYRIVVGMGSDDELAARGFNPEAVKMAREKLYKYDYTNEVTEGETLHAFAGAPSIGETQSITEEIVDGLHRVAAERQAAKGAAGGKELPSTPEELNRAYYEEWQRRQAAAWPELDELVRKTAEERQAAKGAADNE